MNDQIKDEIEATISAGADPRGYEFRLVRYACAVRGHPKPRLALTAGCRDFDSSRCDVFTDARIHWRTRDYSDLSFEDYNPPLSAYMIRAECLAKVDYLETIARIRGWIPSKSVMKREAVQKRTVRPPRRNSILRRVKKAASEKRVVKKTTKKTAAKRKAR